MITITGNIVVTDVTGNVHTISSEDMNIEVVETIDREQGDETAYQGEYEDDTNQFSVTVDVYEYPVGACNLVEVTVDGCTLVSHTIQGELTE